MKKTMKQWMAITCALAMIVSLLPVTILAEEGVATPTDLAPVAEFVQETESAEEVTEKPAEEPAAEPEEEKVTYTARIAAAQRDGKIFLTAVVEPEYTGMVIWEKKTQGAEGEKWVMIDTTSTTLMILPGSDLIGKEIRFRLEDGTTPVLNYVVPELEPVEESAEGNDEPAVEINQEEAIEENETEPAAGETVEEPVTEEEQDIEDYETPLGLDDVIATEPETQEEPSEEPAEEETIVEQTEEEIVVEETEKIPAEVTEEIPTAEETEAADDDLEVEIIEETPAHKEAPATVKTEEAVTAETEQEAEILNTSDLISEEDLPDNAMLLAELLDELNESRKINIYISSESEEIHFGDEVTLYAVLKGYEDCEFTVQWQISPDDQNYTDIEGQNSLTYTFTVTEENYTMYWRIVATITAVNVPDELLAGD